MENENTETYMTAWATAALALLSAIYVTEDIDVDRRKDIEDAVNSAPDKIVFPAALIRPVFMEV